MLAETMEPLPVRRRLTVLRDGSTRTSTMVFCDSQRRCVPLSRCETCGFAGGLERDARGRETAVECTRFTLPSSRSSAPPPSGEQLLAGPGVALLAASLPTGLSLARPVVCVAYDASLSVAARALAMEPSAYGVAVVGDGDRLVGILPRATAALALLGASAQSVAEHMTVEWCSVEEGESLGAAFTTMTTRRAREITVVSDAREVVGTLRDIDALRFLAYVSRTGQRPPIERAA
jgi:CBS domain-containing protein